jgi:hypothetical protein
MNEVVNDQLSVRVRASGVLSSTPELAAIQKDVRYAGVELGEGGATHQDKECNGKSQGAASEGFCALS